MNRRRTARQLPDTPPDADALARGNALLKDE
jgi:hypothetical protein